MYGNYRILYLILAMLKLPFLFLLTTVFSCKSVHKDSPIKSLVVSTPKVYKNISEIPVPEGFERSKAGSGSFAVWLRNIPLKKDKTVHLYDGSVKPDQTAQFAVVDMSVGNRDLQQCADAVMRFRAEYLYSEKRFSEIGFMDDNRKWYRWSRNCQQNGI